MRGYKNNKHKLDIILKNMSRKLLLFVFLLIPLSFFVYIFMFYNDHINQIVNHEEKFIPKNVEQNRKSFRGSEMKGKLKITPIVSKARKSELISSSKEYVDNILLPNMFTLKQSFKAYLPCMNEADPYKCGREREKFPKIVDMIYQDKELMRSHNFTLDILINQENECKKKTGIFIGILTRPKEFLLRNLYRVVYENYTDINYLFFTALSAENETNDMVRQESALFHDMIVFNYISSYWRSSSQMIVIYKYISKYCDNYKYFMYHQGDIYFNYKLFKSIYLNISSTRINTPSTNENISNTTNTTNIVKGLKIYPVIGNKYIGEPVRDPSSPWYVPTDLYPNDTYEPYVSGSCFFLSKDTVNSCAMIADDTKPFIWMDDVYTGLLFKRLGIEIEDIGPLSNVLYPVYFTLPRDIRDIMEKYIFLHTLTPGEVFHILYLTGLAESGK